MNIEDSFQSVLIVTVIIYIDFSLTETAKKKRVVLILPGVTGCSSANYVKEMVLGAKRFGYHAVVINSLVTKDGDGARGDYRVLDFSDSQIIR